MAKPGIERRRFPRHAVEDFYAKYRRRGLRGAFCFRRKETRSRHMVNVSESGAQILSRSPEKVGQRIELLIRTPAFAGNVRISAVVRWCEKTSDGNYYRMGVEFRGISEQKQRWIRSLLNDPLLQSLKKDRRVGR